MALEALDFDPFPADETTPATGGGRLEPLDFDPFAPDTTVLGEVAEVAKGVPEGAVGMVGTSLKGAAAIGKAGQHNAAAFGRTQLDIMDRIDRGEPVPETEDAVGYQHMTDAQKASVRQLATEAAAAFAPGKVQDSALYKGGEAVDEFGKDLVPAAPGYEDSLGRKVGTGLGSMVGALGASVVGGPVVGGAFLASSGAGEAADRAVQAKASEEQIIQSALAGLAPGATDLVPIEALLGHLPLPGAKLLQVPANMAGAVLRASGRIGRQALIEGLQEGGQEFLQNLIAKEVYKPDQPLMAEVPESAGIGGIVGGLVETAATPFRRRGGVSPNTSHRFDPTILDDQRLDSPRLTPADRASPLPNSLIDDGKALMEGALADAGKEAIPVDETGVPIGWLDPSSGRMEMPEPPNSPFTQSVNPADSALDGLGGLGAQPTAPDAPESPVVEDRPQAAGDTAPAALNEDEAPAAVHDVPLGTAAVDLPDFTGGGAVASGLGDGTRQAPALVEAAQDIERAGQQVADEPSDAQKEAGNYKKAHLKLGGLEITVENVKGSMRRGKGADGTEWSVEMPAHYGYIKRSVGADGDHVDVYVADNPRSQQVFIVDQVDPDTNEFDEHKVVLGASSMDEAKSLYQSGFSDGRGGERMGAITFTTMDRFKDWLTNGDTTQPLGTGVQVKSQDDASRGKIQSQNSTNNSAVSAVAENESETSTEQPAEPPTETPTPSTADAPSRPKGTPQVPALPGMTPLGAKPPVPTPFQPPSNGAHPLDPFAPGTGDITGYDGDDFGRGAPRKEAFLKAGRQFLGPVAKALRERGFDAKPDRKGKPGKAISVNPAGPAVAGDVYLDMQLPSGVGVQVQIGAAFSPAGGLQIMARRTLNGRSGPNQFWPQSLSADELARRLLKLAGVDEAPAPEPASQEPKTTGAQPAEKPAENITENITAPPPADFAEAGLWWKEELTPEGRRQAAEAAGLAKKRALVLWHNLTKDEQEKLAEVRRTTAIGKPDAPAAEPSPSEPVPDKEDSDVGRSDDRPAGPPRDELLAGPGELSPGEPSQDLPDDAGQRTPEAALPGDRGSSGGVSGGRGGPASDQPESSERPDGADSLLPVDPPDSGRAGKGGVRLRPAKPSRSDNQVSADERARTERAARNYRITPEDEIGQGGPKAKVRANIKALRILKQIEEEKRPATPEEKKALVKFVGWGAFAQPIFDTRAKRDEWATERGEVLDLLSPEEVTAARRSTLNAHYTSESVIRGMWAALEHLGFKGGRAVEPSAGVGHFIGLTPDKVHKQTAWSAVELETVTGRIAQLLYEGADVNIMGFQDFHRPDGFFDLAISNVPFGDFTIRDTKRPGFLIHDYFFVKSLDVVRSGGLVAFITSDGTMDKLDKKARRAMIERGDFLGAIRLPGGKTGAFAGNAGTQVTTDIIFMRPRAKGVVPSKDQGQRNSDFLELKRVATPEGEVPINAYFADKPDMMLGEMRKIGSMYGPDQKVLVGDSDNLDTRIAEAAKALPKNAMLPRATTSERLTKKERKADTSEDVKAIKEGSIYLKDGQVFRRINGVGEPFKLSAADQKKLPDFLAMRDAVNALLHLQSGGKLEGATPEQLRKDLTKAYDRFVKANGPINKIVTTVQERKDKATGETKEISIRRFPNFTPFADDPDAYKTAAIENYDEATDKATKAAIFTQDIVGSYVPPDVTGPTDAIVVSLNERGKVDIPLIAARLGVSPSEAIKQLGDLAYLDPAGEQWRTSGDYLSGDVVTKLEQARAAAKTEPQSFARNVAALEKVQPAPLTRVDIQVPMGAGWVPAEVYTAFFKSLGSRGTKVRVNPITKTVSVEASFDTSAESKFGTSRASVLDVANAALRQTTFKIYDKDAKGDLVLNQEATQAVALKVAAMREAFSGNPDMGVEGWIWQDDARSAELEAIYNRSFNRLVPTVYDGAHLALPGLAKTIAGADGSPVAFALRPHQKNAVWRMIQSGNTLLDHVVGAGKTFTMIAGAMEQKRLGLIQRPMFVVPNHMLEQFSREFYQAYPNAKLLIATKDQMVRARRKEFAARVAADKWDGIIITHDAFGRIRMSDAAYETYFRDEIARMQLAIDAAREESGAKDRTVKEMEKAREKLQARLEALANKERKDDGVTFEELGIDQLLVDEMHLFKNLRTPTRHTRVKGIGKSASQRAEDMFIKIRSLEKTSPGRAIITATGTPISNTMAEMYVMQRYMQLDTLREYGVDEFDAWAATFGSIETKIELAPNGRTMQEVTGFRSFVNIPELVALYAKFADVQTAEMLNLPRPKRKGGTITVVEAEPNAEEEAYIASLVQRAEDMKGKRVEKGGDNMLKVVSEGRKVATDFRLIDPANPVNPEGKAAKLVANVLRIYKAGKHPGLAQMIFLDMGTPFKAKARPTVAVDEDVETTMPEDEGDGPNLDESEALASKFNLYEDLRERLVKQGIPKKEIAFIHEASNDLQKAALFRKVRSGEVRVLIGSTAKMGVGTNVQRVLVAMHHMDAPWKPAEVEQRDGRIERQGNLNPEIEILRYVTKRSFDSFMWQTLERKARFIGQIKAGARGIRTAEDIDDPLPEAATLKAAAAGDPRIMEHAELTKEVRDLEMQARNHERDIQRARVSIDYERVRVGEDRERQRKLDADVAALKDTKGDKFAMSLIRGGDFTDRTKAGEAVKDFMVRSGAAVWSGTPTVWKLGSVGGLNMGASVLRSSDGVEVSTFLEGEARYFSGRPFLLTDDVDPLGLIRRFEAPLRDIPGMAAEMPGVIKQRQESIARLEKQAESKPFPKRERLIETKRRLIELEAALKPKDPNKTPEAGEGGTVMAMADSPNGWGTVEGGSTFAMDVREGDRVIPLGKDITDTKIDVIAPRNPERAEAIRAAIQEGLEAIGVGDIKTVVVEEIGMSRADGNNHRAHGFMWGDVLAIAMTSQEGRGLSWTVSHEALHAISKLGVLSKSEWKLLIDKSKRVWMDRYGIDGRYPGRLEMVKIEEGIAEAFAEHVNGTRVETGLIGRLFDKIRRFLEAVRNALAGRGFKTADDVFAAILSGEVGARRPRNATGQFVPYMDAAVAAMGNPYGGAMFQLGGAGGPAPQATTQSFLQRGQLLDRAIRAPFDWFGGIDAQGRWNPGQRLHAGATRILTESRIDPNGRFGWMSGMVENARHGLIDRYGLPQDYIDRDRGMDRDKRRVLQQAAEILERLSANRVGGPEARVLQAILTGEAVDDTAMQALAEPIRNAIDELGAEMVELGLISPDSYERNRGSYLHRVYLKHESEANALESWFSRFMKKRRVRILGDELKGRGLFLKVAGGRLTRDFPDGAAMPAIGGQVRVFTKGSGHGSRHVYWPADRSIPERLRGEEWQDRGTWEVRFADRTGANITLWRDYTVEERQAMGEMLDARYTIGKTFMLMANDIAAGKFFRDIADNPDWSTDEEPAAPWKDAGDYGRYWTDRSIEWVKVPDSTISKSGGKKKWGALAGRWVRAEIWRDMHELDMTMRPSTWRTLLSQWKLNKTARSPVVHMNNVMSNVMFMDLADVRVQDLIRGVRSFLTKDAHYREAQAQGAFGSDMMSQEIRDNVLKPILDELLRSQQGGVASSMLARWGAIGRVTDIIWTWAKAADRKMIDAYRLEDEIFRMATYWRRRELGDSPEQAAGEARATFLDYDVRAPWVNAARSSVLPFITYTYRAVPQIAKAVSHRPWKLAKYFAVAYALNALAYMATGDDDDDERRERASLRQEEQGGTWIGVPRMMRMPYRDEHGLPVFLDIRRWIPAGDVFDLKQANSAIPIPAPLQMGGPALMAFELALNRQSFTGENITNNITDDAGDKTGKIGDYLWKSWMPSAPWVPGSWYNEKIVTAIEGGTDRAGRPYGVPEAVASSVGIKLKPQDVETGIRDRLYFDFEKTERELKVERRRISRQRTRNLISQSEHDSMQADVIEKLRRTAEERREFVDSVRQ